MKQPTWTPVDQLNAVIGELQSRADNAPESQGVMRRRAPKYTELLPVIEILRRKNYPQKEVFNWLSDNGIVAPRHTISKLCKMADGKAT